MTVAGAAPRRTINPSGRAKGFPTPADRIQGPRRFDDDDSVKFAGSEQVLRPAPLFTDISLDLRVGERIGLIGPNGSGKSTLLKILAGLETPDTGIVSVGATARLGYLAQESGFDPQQTR